MRPLFDYTFAFEKALDKFDFKTVQIIMRLLNWEWSGIGLPKENDMRRCCWNLFHAVSENISRTPEKITFASSGGFEVRITGKEIEISFILADSSCSFEDNNTSAYGNSHIEYLLKG